MNPMPNLFDDETRKNLVELYGATPKPTREEYLAHLKAWQIEADEQHSASQIAQIAADQARRVKCMKGA